MTDYTLMIAATTGVCSYVAGIVTMGVLAGGRIADWKKDWQYELDVKRLYRKGCIELQEKLRTQGRELAEYRAARTRSTANLIRANAARKAKRLEREAAAVALRDKTHAKLRELVGG